MEIYAWGILFGFLLGCIRLVSLVARIQSVKSKNLRQAGLYLHRIKGIYQSKPNTSGGWLAYLVGLFIVKPAFSWLYLAIYLEKIFKLKKSKNPTCLELSKKLDRKILPKESVVALLDDYSQEPFPTEEELITEYSYFASLVNGNAEDPYDARSFDEHDEYGRSNTVVNMSNKTFTTKSSSTDWSSEWLSVYEYRLVGSDIEIRTINSGSKSYSEEYDYNIRDNVVQENKIRSKSIKYRDVKEEAILEKIARYKKEIEWHVMPLTPLKLWLMKDFSGMSLIEYRRYLQLEKGRIEKGRQQAIEVLKSLKVEVEIDEKHMLTTKYQEDMSPQERETAGKWFENDRVVAFGINETELMSGEILVRRIEKALKRCESA